MRIVGLKEFLTLKNILYCTYTGAYGDFLDSYFLIKWGNCGIGYNDWVESDLNPSAIEISSSYYDDGVVKLEQAEKDSSLNISMDFEFTGRYAGYPRDDNPIKFAVYEKEDIKNMISVLQKLLEKHID